MPSTSSHGCMREEAIRAHCIANHVLPLESFTEIDLTSGKKSFNRCIGVFQVECICSALGGTLVVAAGSGFFQAQDNEVALAVVLKVDDGSKLGTLLHSENHDCIDSVIEIAHGYAATSVCGRGFVGIGSSIKIWDLKTKEFELVQVNLLSAFFSHCPSMHDRSPPSL